MAKPFFKIFAKSTFNVNKAQKMTERTERAYLFRVGAYTMTVARNSLGRITRGAYASPGSPPKNKTNSMKRGIRFKVLMEERSVIIGPERDNSKKNSLVLHEVGGTRTGKATRVLMPVKEIREGDIKPGLEPLKSNKRGFRRVFIPPGIRTYKPRPYMAPALKTATEQNQAKFWVGVK